jgi:outer membrane protein assembly complex protein YaeT
LPRRVRRLFKIAAGLILAAGILLLILMATPWPSRLVQREIARRIEALGGGRLEIASLEIRFFPPRLVARGIRFEQAGPGQGKVQIASGEADLSVPYGIYLGSLDRIDSLRLVRPEILLERGTGEAPAAPASGGGGAGGRLPDLGRLVIEGGSVRVRDPAAGWEVALSEMDLHGEEGKPGRVEGALDHCIFMATQGGRQVSGRMGGAFRAGGKSIAVTSFHLGSMDSSFQGTGSFDLNLGGEVPQFHAAGEVSLSRAAAPRAMIGDLAGRLRLDLHGERLSDGLHLSGSAAAPEIRYHGWTAQELSAQVRYQPGELSAAGVSARMLGGKVSGEAGLRWMVGDFHRARLDARADLRGGSAKEILQRLDLPDLPLTGRVDHTGQYRMDLFDPSSLEAEGEIGLSGRLLYGSQEAVGGAGRFRIASSALVVETATLRTASASAELQGKFAWGAPSRSDARLKLVSHTLAPLDPLLARLPPAARAPLAEIFRDSQDSDLTFDGTLARDAAGTRLAGRVEARSLALRGSRLGDFTGEFSASPSRVEVTRASFSGGDVTLDLSGWLRPGAPADAGETFALKGSVAGLEMTWLSGWTALPLPVEGKVGGSFDLSGGREGLLGTVEWRMSSLRVASIPLDAAGGKISLVPGGMLLEEAHLSRGDGKMEASGSIGFGGAPVLVYVDGTGIQLEWLRDAGLLPPETGGTVRIQGRVTGTLDEPSAEADLETPALTVKGIALGAIAARFNADRRGGEIQICPEEKGIALAGKVDWSGSLPFQADLELEAFEVNAASLGSGLAGVDASAVLTGSAHASGMLRDASKLDASGTLQKASLRLGQEELATEGPVTFRWRPPRLELTPFHLAGAGTSLDISGQLDPEGGTYRLAVEGETALSNLAAFWPGVVAGGTGAFSVSLNGSPAGTHLEGWASVLGGRLQGGGLPFPVSSVQGRLVMDPPGGFHLEGVTALVGGGDVRLEGKGSLEGVSLKSLAIDLHGNNVLILAPEGFRGRYDMELKLTQDVGGRFLSGDIHLIRGVYDRDFRLEKNLLSMGREEPAPMAEEEEAPEGKGLLQTVQLDLDLEASRGLWIINDFATLEGTASFHVGGTVHRPEITGRVSALEGGTIRFRNVRYRVDRGIIDLTDVEKFNPYLDIAAETTVSDYQVNLKLQGNLDSFTYELTSSPPLTQPEIIALLVSGRSPNTALETGRVAQDMATTYLTEGLASGLGGAIQGVTGLDQFSIDPLYLTNQGDPASRVTVGKQISENLFAAYSTLIGSSSEEIYQLEYRISRDFKFTSTREADGSVGGDLRYFLRQSTGPGGAAPAAAPERTRIEEVLVEGDPGIPEKKLRHIFRVEAGDPLDRARVAARVEKILKKYHRKERWQASVETREEPGVKDPGQVRLILKADAGPEIRIRIEGDPSPGKHRKALESLWSKSVFPEDTPEEARAKLERSLREEGYYRVKATVKLETDTPALRDAVFTVETGPRVKVEKIEISGNESISTSSLDSFLQTKTGRRGYLRPERVNSDAGRIRARYVMLGFAEVVVAPPEIQLSEDGRSATVRFAVREGNPTKVAAIKIEGNTAISSDKLKEGLPFHLSEPFTREKARGGAESIRLAYDREGYTRAKVTYELRGEEGPLLLYHVDEGTRRIVGKIEIEGNRLTRKEVVERELTIKEGKPLSLQEISSSQKALFRLGTFSAVEIKEVDGEDPSRPTVRVRLTESKNLTQALGIGYATDEGVRGLYDVTNSNLLGRARTIGLQLRGSQVNNRVQLILRDPFLFNRRLDSLLSIFRSHEERDSFTLNERGATLQVSNKHGEKDRTIYRYIYKDDNVMDLQITPEEAGVESIRLSGFGAGYVHDSRDNFYNPRKGTFASVDLTAYGKAIGSEAAFLKFFAQGSLFRPVPGDCVWAQSMRVGLADPFGISDSIPLSERFFAGGDTTVRGFKFDQLGPKDPVTGEPVGGESLFIVNEEFRFPIWSFLRGVVFFDAGNVTSQLSDFNPLDLRTVLGAGFRIDTPIGPVRFEYGWKLDREEGESAGELHITIGPVF